MQSIQVSICENGKEGWPCQKASLIEFSLYGETFLRLEPLYMDLGVDVFTSKQLIIIDDVRIKHIGRKMWYGNKSFNLYNVPFSYALGLIEVLMMSRKWVWTEGWSNIIEKWAKFETITGNDLELDEDYQPIVANANQYEIKFEKTNS